MAHDHTVSINTKLNTADYFVDLVIDAVSKGEYDAAMKANADRALGILAEIDAELTEFQERLMLIKSKVDTAKTIIPKPPL